MIPEGEYITMFDNPIIMVVDDQPDFVEGVKLILEVEGYDVWTASDGKQAIERLQKATRTMNDEERRLPDLILADIMMPIMDGYALYEQTQINPNLKHIPFIFLTAKTAVSDLEHGKALGVEDYLTKPCVPDVLLASVRGHLKEKTGGDDHAPVNEQVPALPQLGSRGMSTGNVILIILAVILVVLTLVTTYSTTNFGG